MPITLRNLKQHLKQRHREFQAYYPEKIWKKQQAFTLINEQELIDPVFREQLQQLNQQRNENKITETQMETQVFTLLNQSIKKTKKSNLS
ncbi:MAG: hypothetical protein JW703_02115 [Candidatus Diapherotrites archaeon]|nr:hypothetical protein [Candidatus Diapherotrites archaeon]